MSSLSRHSSEQTVHNFRVLLVRWNLLLNSCFWPARCCFRRITTREYLPLPACTPCQMIKSDSKPEVKAFAARFTKVQNNGASTSPTKIPQYTKVLPPFTSLSLLTNEIGFHLQRKQPECLVADLIKNPSMILIDAGTAKVLTVSREKMLSEEAIHCHGFSIFLDNSIRFCFDKPSTTIRRTNIPEFFLASLIVSESVHARLIDWWIHLLVGRSVNWLIDWLIGLFLCSDFPSTFFIYRSYHDCMAASIPTGSAEVCGPTPALSSPVSRNFARINVTKWWWHWTRPSTLPTRPPGWLKWNGTMRTSRNATEWWPARAVLHALQPNDRLLFGKGTCQLAMRFHSAFCRLHFHEWVFA